MLKFIVGFMVGMMWGCALGTHAHAVEKIIAPVVMKDGKEFTFYDYLPKPSFPDHAACQQELNSEAFKDAVADAQKIADKYAVLGEEYAGMKVKPKCAEVRIFHNDKEEK